MKNPQRTVTGLAALAAVVAVPLGAATAHAAQTTGGHQPAMRSAFHAAVQHDATEVGGTDRIDCPADSGSAILDQDMVGGNGIAPGPLVSGSPSAADISTSSGSGSLSDGSVLGSGSSAGSFDSGDFGGGDIGGGDFGGFDG